MAISPISKQTDEQLAQQIALFYDDPLGFVMFAYPWGEEQLPDGTSNPLREKIGPEPWQRRLLVKIGEHIKANNFLTRLKLQKEVGRFARASGHDVGKSAFVAWLVHFFMSTRRDTRITVTANTAAQLETKTWPELAKWHDLLINKHWFTWTATSYYFKLYPVEKQKNYAANAYTVGVDNTEAFAGLHNETGTVVIIFDEASGIFAKLWEVAQGAVMDGEGYHFAFGNPTEPTGEFADCFDRNAKMNSEGMMYDIETIDSREVSFSNKNAIRDILRRWGPDSDQAKVRVYGQFPTQSFQGFISHEMVEAAVDRPLFHDSGAAVIMGVDGAAQGRSASVIRIRRGRDARTVPPLTFYNKTLTQLAEIVAREADKHRPDAITVESVGPTAGLIDILRDRKYRVIAVHPGAFSSDRNNWDRVRDEMWCRMRDWLADDGCIADEPRLKEQLTSIHYALDKHDQFIKLEAKQDYMDRTQLQSPDEADSLALTFAVTIRRRDRNLDFKGGGSQGETVSDYDPMLYDMEAV